MPVLLRMTLFLGLLVLLNQEVAESAPCTISIPYEGFGKTTGGEGKLVYRVTNLNDSGPGSLRDAVSQGNRCVAFDVAGTINLTSMITVRGSYITIDGFSAPAPGITLKKYGISFNGQSYPAHDVVVRGLRIRQEDCPKSVCEEQDVDGIQVNYGQNMYKIVIDRNSFSGAPDENLALSVDARDITVSWNIFAKPQTRNVLVAYTPLRISIHHNLFTEEDERNPHVDYDLTAGEAPEITADVRNNLVAVPYVGYGAVVRNGAKANVINNYYAVLPGGEEAFSQDRIINVCQSNPPSSLSPVIGDCQRNFPNYRARAYVKGNVSALPTPVALDAWTTEAQPFAAAPVTTTDACSAAAQVYANAGARGPNFGLDTMDQGFVSRVPLGSCSAPASTSLGPSNLRVLSP